MQRMRPIDASALDQRVTLQARQAGQDTRGQPSMAWQDVATVWASVRPLRGRDFVAAGAAQATFDCTVRMRWRSGVTAGMRLMWRGQPLEIVGEPVDVDGGRHTLELMCTYGVRAGLPA